MKRTVGGRRELLFKRVFWNNGSELMKNMNLTTHESQAQIVNKTKSIPRDKMNIPNYKHKEKVLKETREKNDTLQRGKIEL